MTIHLPIEIERSIQAAVLNGRFASLDEAMVVAARLLLKEIDQQDVAPHFGPRADTGLGSIGAMQDAADELDEAMKYAMELRQQPWRVPYSE